MTCFAMSDVDKLLKGIYLQDEASQFMHLKWESITPRRN